MKHFRKKYKFSDKNQALGGVLSILLGAATLALLLYGVYLAFRANGNAGVEVGSLGILCLLLAVVGTIIGFLSFREEDKFYTTSKIGTIACGILTIFMLFVFIMGL